MNRLITLEYTMRTSYEYVIIYTLPDKIEVNILGHRTHVEQAFDETLILN